MSTIPLTDGERFIGTMTIADHYTIEVDGKVYALEDCYPHPWPLDKDGEPIGRKCKAGYPRKWEGVPFWKHRFWTAAWWWKRQGSRLDGNKCIWEPVFMYKPIIEMRGRHRFVVGDGEKYEVQSWMPQAIGGGPFTQPPRK